jgi:hypothetical protein
MFHFGHFAKFHPIYVLRADSERRLNALEPAGSADRVTFAQNCWMTGEVILNYILWLDLAIHDEPCPVVMNSFPRRVMEAVYAKSWILNLKMIPVPRGLIGEYQPLNRGGLGRLTMISQYLRDGRAAANRLSNGKLWNLGSLLKFGGCT